MRLLIAEDDPRLLKSLLHIFTSNQYAADGVSNGTDALDYARTGEYDGFVFDIMMPGADGLTVLSTLRREGITTPTLFLSIPRWIGGLRGWTRERTIICPSPFRCRNCWRGCARCCGGGIASRPMWSRSGTRP